MPFVKSRDRFIVGTPDDLISEDNRYASELGVTTLILRIQWAGMQQQQVLSAIQLIGESVLTAVG